MRTRRATADLAHHRNGFGVRVGGARRGTGAGSEPREAQAVAVGQGRQRDGDRCPARLRFVLRHRLPQARCAGLRDGVPQRDSRTYPVRIEQHRPGRERQTVASPPQRRSVPASGVRVGPRFGGKRRSGCGRSPSMAPARSSRSTLPLPCTIPVDAVTPVAGRYTITIPLGCRSRGQDRSEPRPQHPSSANPARPAVAIRSQGGIAPRHAQQGDARTEGSSSRRRSSRTGSCTGCPEALDTRLQPAQHRRSSRSAFVACTATPPGTVTLTEHLVPQDDPGRFDLAVDGADQSSGCRRSRLDRTYPAQQRSSMPSASSPRRGPSSTTTPSRSPAWKTRTRRARSPRAARSLGQIPVTAGDDWRCDVTSTRADEIDLGSITVGSTPETNHASSKQIGPLGGTVEATSADGTRYSLSISPNALRSPNPDHRSRPTAVTGLEADRGCDPRSRRVRTVRSQRSPSPRGSRSLRLPAPRPSTSRPPGRTAPPASTSACSHRAPTARSWSRCRTSAASPRSRRRSPPTTTCSPSRSSSLPGLGGLPQQLLTDTQGLPGTSAAVATDIQTIYDGFVKPLIDQAGNSLVELQLASLRLGDFEALIQHASRSRTCRWIPGHPRRPWRIC